MKRISRYVLALAAVTFVMGNLVADPHRLTNRGWKIYKKFVKRQIIQSQVAPGWGTAGYADGKAFHNYQGHRDIDFPTGANPKPMTDDTIIRLGSQSKMVTAVAFLTLADKGYAALEDNVSDYIPAYANTKVIEPCAPYSFRKLGYNPLQTTAGSQNIVVTDENHGLVTGDRVIITQTVPTWVGVTIPGTDVSGVFTVTVLDPDHYEIVVASFAAVSGNFGEYFINVAPFAANASHLLGLDPISTLNGSNVITVADAGHTYVVGDVIGIQLSTAVDGIPASEINNVHTITAVVPGVSYSFVVTTVANASVSGGGAEVTVFSLCFGAQQIQYLGATYYYKLQDLVAPLKVHHLLSHTSGHSYGVLGIGAQGFDPNIVGVYRGIALTAGGFGAPIPEGAPNPALPLSFSDVQTWATAYAQIPLMYQPGSQWSYGPQMGILGAIIELADPKGRNLEQFMKDELFDKLEMTDTGFFVQGGPGNPTWDDKVGRFAVLYDNAFAQICSLPFLPIDYTGPICPFHASFAAVFGFAQSYNYDGPRVLALGDGGLYSTFPDMARFLEMLLNNGRNKKGEVILSSAMIDTLSRNQIDDKDISAVSRLLPSASQEVKQARWGLGVGINQGVNVETTGASEKLIYWNGVFQSTGRADFSNKLVLQLGTNVLSINTVLDRDEALAVSLLMNAVKRVHGFKEQLYTPGIASPDNYNTYVS